ncbi:MAG: tetratricopeptide repeat protein [Chloroflexi bacterium]|nr:tetratricopeptide repeat protein [Chloroflexota bacterium]
MPKRDAQKTFTLVTETITRPKTSSEFIRQGWSHYSNKEYYRAEDSFRKALDLTPDDPDTLYALAMTLFSSGRKQESIPVYRKVIEVLNRDPDQEKGNRETMLIRMAYGHINFIETGQWRMEA